MSELIQVSFRPGHETERVFQILDQWDKGKELQLIGLEDLENIEVHFSFNPIYGNAEVVNTEIVDNSVIAPIPQHFLENEGATGITYSIYAFVYYTKGQFADTLKRAELIVRTRPKPKDYSFNPGVSATDIENAVNKYLDENPIEAVSDKQIEEAVYNYLLENPIEGVTDEQVASAVEAYLLEHPIEGGTISNEQIAQAVSEYMAENPLEAGATKEQAAQIEKNKQDIGKLSEQMNDLKQNGTIVSSVEPMEDDIPKVFFDEAIPQTKDDVVTKFRYISKTLDFEGYAEFKAQGNSSMNYPKKNMTVKMYKDEALEEKLKVDFKGWGKQSKHVYKANWIDLLHARNVVSARIWADVVKSRSNYLELPELYRTSPNQGAVDGFPVKVYSQGIYQGRYTLNIPKDAWMSNMDDELDTHCILCGEGYNSGCFRQASMSQWTDEVHDTRPTTITNRWIEVIIFVMNSTDEEFKTNLGNYFYVDSLIDYFIYGMVSCGLDAFGKNQLYFTYDGLKWIAGMYDMDSTWGLYWNGSKFVSASYTREQFEDFASKESSGDGNLLYVRLAELFYEEIQARYEELKNGALSVPNIINHFERFTDIAPLDLVKEDYASTTESGKFTGIPSKDTNNIQQVRQFVIDRYVYCDEYFASLNGGGEEEPETPTDKTLSSISATYNGGNVEVGTALTSLSGITVTGTWSDGSTSTITGYTLTGEIAEGENTITVSYNGLTTTFAVTGYSEVEEPSIETPDDYIYSLTERTFDGVDDYVDTGIQLCKENKSFSFAIHFKGNSDSQPAQNTIMHCINEVSPYDGLCLMLSYNKAEGYRISTQSRHAILDVAVNGEGKVVLTRDATNNTTKVTCLHDNGEITEQDLGYRFYSVDQNLLLGCYQTKDGTKGRFWDGTIYDFKLYDRVLSEDEINAWLIGDTPEDDNQQSKPLYPFENGTKELETSNILTISNGNHVNLQKTATTNCSISHVSANIGVNRPATSLYNRDTFFELKVGDVVRTILKHGEANTNTKQVAVYFAKAHGTETLNCFADTPNEVDNTITISKDFAVGGIGLYTVVENSVVDFDIEIYVNDVRYV